ncbi:MAG TPA: hypothetical protein VL634_15155 [Mycobacterium sp.]|nr:hypothetical protein [Mycobacterium sp.]
MATCPNGHHNPKNEQLCAVCDALIVSTERRSLSGRAWWVIIATSTVAAIVLAAVLGVIVTRPGAPEISSAPTTVESNAMQQWWSVAREHVEEFQTAVDNTRSGLARQDEPLLRTSCQDMHDAGGVALRAHLPAPDPDLTSELDAAINDSHEAAHMCLAAISGSINNYSGEFKADLDQADMHLRAALDIVSKKLLTA